MFLFHLNIPRPANQKQANLHCSSLFATKYGHTIVCMLSCLLCLTLRPHALVGQAPLSMEFSRQEYWSGLPFPSPGYLPNSGIKQESPALQVDSLPTELWGKHQNLSDHNCLWLLNGNTLSILAWKIPWTKEPGRLQYMGSQESDTT